MKALLNPIQLIVSEAQNDTPAINLGAGDRETALLRRHRDNNLVLKRVIVFSVRRSGGFPFW
jgi:hypothetical protein